MTEADFNVALEKHGFTLLKPGTHDVPCWGYIDIGNGVRVDRWRGGSTLAEQLAYCIATRAKLDAKPQDCKATICSSRWKGQDASAAKTACKKVAKKVVKKVVERPVKKGGKK